MWVFWLHNTDFHLRPTNTSIKYFIVHTLVALRRDDAEPLLYTVGKVLLASQGGKCLPTLCFLAFSVWYLMFSLLFLACFNLFM